jgi:type I restriction enzyme, S subunit
MICTASGSKSHLGKVAFIDDDYGYAFGGFMGMITPQNGLLPKYLFHLMTSNDYKDFIGEVSDGANINNLKFDDLRKFQIPHPPLAEQQRIVNLVDEAFAGLATAKANTEKNLKNARGVFESHLQSIFATQRKGWTDKSVGELVAEGVLVKPFDGNHGEIHPKRSDYTKSGVPFIMARDLVDGAVDTQNCIFISRELAESLRVGLAKDGDVLISHKGTIGRSAVLSTEYSYIMLTPQLTSYRVKDDNKLFNRFIRYHLMSPTFQREMIAGAADGSTRAYISITKQLNLRFRFPSLLEQKNIVAELDILDQETKRLENLYERKLAALDALKKSLLHQAFTGGL